MCAAEDWPEIFIGCAGGGDSRLALPVTFTSAPTGTEAFQASVSGADALAAPSAPPLFQHSGH